MVTSVCCYFVFSVLWVFHVSCVCAFCHVLLSVASCRDLQHRSVLFPALLSSSVLAPVNSIYLPAYNPGHPVHITLQHRLLNKSLALYFLSQLSTFGSLNHNQHHNTQCPQQQLRPWQQLTLVYKWSQLTWTNDRLPAQHTSSTESISFISTEHSVWKSSQYRCILPKEFIQNTKPFYMRTSPHVRDYSMCAHEAASLNHCVQMCANK